MDISEEFFSVNECAKFFGVTPHTIRVWNKERKLVGYRHPINGRLLYKKMEMQCLKENIEKVGGW